MKWIIQENLYNEEGYNSLLRALEVNQTDFSVHKVVPFSDILIPEVTENKVFALGAGTMHEIAKNSVFKTV